MSETNQSANEARLAHALLVATQELSSSRAECERLRKALETSCATLHGVKGMAETESRNGSNAWGRAVGLLNNQLKENVAALSEKEKA